MTGLTAAVIWLIFAVILFVIEGLTVQLLTIWFAIGSLAAMLAAMFNAPVWVQLMFFFITAILVLVFGRPFLKKRLTPKRVATNADAVIGQEGLVIEEIDNTMQTGRVRANGLDWTARSDNGEIIKVHQRVKVIHIDGVKLIVKPFYEDNGGNV